MDYLVIFFLSIIVLTLIIGKANKYLFSILFLIGYLLYNKQFNREHFQDTNILALDNQLNFFDENNMTLAEYEKQNNVKITILGDSYIEIPVGSPKKTPEESLDRSILRYGDTVLVQCLAHEHRFLTGNRDSHSPDTKMNTSGVFTTNEEEVLLKWTIMSFIKDDTLIGTPIPNGTHVKFVCQHPTINGKVLVTDDSNYNRNSNKYSVYTARETFTNDTVINSKFTLETDEVGNGLSLTYNMPIKIKTSDNSNNYLIGATGMGFVEGETNQMVENHSINTSAATNGSYLYWCFKKSKENGVRPFFKNRIKMNDDELNIISGTDQADIRVSANTPVNKIKFTKEKMIKTIDIRVPIDERENNIRFNLYGSDNYGTIFDIGGGYFDIEHKPYWLEDNNLVRVIKMVGGTDTHYYTVNAMTLGLYQSTNANIFNEFKINVLGDNKFILTKIIRGRNYVMVIKNNSSAPILSVYNSNDILKDSILHVRRVNGVNQLITETGKSISGNLFNRIVNKRNNPSVEIIKIPINKSLKTLSIKNHTIPNGSEIYINGENITSLLENVPSTFLPPIGNNDITNISVPENIIQKISLNEKKYIRGLVLSNQSLNVDKIRVYVSINDNIYTNLGDFEKRNNKIMVPVNQSIRFIKIKLMDCSGTTACQFSLSAY